MLSLPSILALRALAFTSDCRRQSEDADLPTDAGRVFVHELDNGRLVHRQRDRRMQPAAVQAKACDQRALRFG